MNNPHEQLTRLDIRGGKIPDKRDKNVQGTRYLTFLEGQADLAMHDATVPTMPRHPSLPLPSLFLSLPQPNLSTVQKR